MAEKQRILIVDDDNNIAELISLYLTKECFETIIVNDGEEALRVFPEFKPNLVLLDLMLPGMDGYSVCREMRAQSPVPIIMLSAKGEVFDKVLGPVSYTHLETPSGLDSKEHYSTAYDMALLGCTAIKNPEFAAVCSQKRCV